MNSDSKYFLPFQNRWVLDRSPLKIIQKSRQIGISYADSYHSVRMASADGARFDVYISSRDRFQAKLYLEDCRHWAKVLEIIFSDLGEILFDPDTSVSAYVLEFANGRRIYSLSSNPNALAGKRGHVKLDEFALHADQRLLYRVAKPVTMWGGTLSIISTHRGSGSLFNQIVRDILDRSNPMAWSLHTVSLETAVAEGLVERINKKAGRDESREAFLQRLRAECIDEEQWLQEYCCIPADESAAFISYEMLDSCEDSHLELMSLDQLVHVLSGPLSSSRSFYLGLDVARKTNLCVFDVGERIGSVVHDRLRLELLNRPFSEIESVLHRLLRLPAIRRACIDATGLGMQLAEQARERFGSKVEPVTFTPAAKEKLAFTLRTDFESLNIRVPRDQPLRTDLRSIKKDVSINGNIRFSPEREDTPCDRFWAKALRQQAARYRPSIAAFVA